MWVGWFVLAVFGFAAFAVNSVGHFSLFVLDFVWIDGRCCLSFWCA